MDDTPSDEVKPGASVGPADLIYGLNDKPPLRLSIFVALQHVLAVFVGIVTPPAIIAHALELPNSDGAFLISMALMASGAGTLVQTLRLGPFGSGLLNIQGTSFVFVGPTISLAGSIIAAGGARQHALAVVFGVCLAAALVPIVLGPFIRFASRIITPLVTGIVVTLIGLTLVQVGIMSVGGGFDAKHDGSFGSVANLGLAGLVIALIVFMSSSSRAWSRVMSVVAALAAGYVVAFFVGKVSFTGLSDLPWFAVPTPLRYGLGFRATALLPFGFLYLMTAIESIGDITATSLLTGEPITGPGYLARLRGGVLADGVSSALAALFNSFPSTTFAQNNGVIQLTGIASRHVGILVGILLIILGLFPPIGGIVQAMPPAVLGGATIVMFGTVAMAGIRILAATLDRRACTIAAVSLGLGLGVTFVPEISGALPALLRDMFASGIATGGMCAILLNIVVPDRSGSVSAVAAESLPEASE
jgi:xanthine permease XanP